MEKPIQNRWKLFKCRLAWGEWIGETVCWVLNWLGISSCNVDGIQSRVPKYHGRTGRWSFEHLCRNYPDYLAEDFETHLRSTRSRKQFRERSNYQVLSRGRLARQSSHISSSLCGLGLKTSLHARLFVALPHIVDIYLFSRPIGAVLSW